jgi:N6-adenosine-specific RNA methylase IME4
MLIRDWFFRTDSGPQPVATLGGYDVIYSDPPWGYNDKGCNGAQALHYPSMSFEELAALPVERLAAKNAALFLWATYPKLEEALALIPRWGFKYKSIAFQWVKTYRSGKPFFGLGRWTRGNTEPCLLAVRGKPARVANDVSQLIFTEAGPGEELLVSQMTRHSAKPPETRERISRLMGPGAYVEMFARETAPDWDCWGNEVSGNLVLSAADSVSTEAA